MAACLLVMVAGFYFVIVIPGLHRSIDRLVGQYAREIAVSSPDYATAKRLATALDMQMRYEGPDTTWATDARMPTLEALARVPHAPAMHASFPRRAYYVVHAPKGGTYVFERRFGERLHVAHSRMVLLLLLLMAGVFLTAYVVLQRALRPLRLLSESVARLSEGQLDVVVPNPTRDEFGALTHAFNRMAARVRDMVRARDQLLLDVSHELRSPITRLKVALALLPESTNRAGMAADVAEMEVMVTELLELERLRDGRGIRTERVDLAAVLREAAANFCDRPPGVRLSSEVSEILLDLDGDKVRTVLRNLLENAIKYSFPDSRPVEMSVTESAEEAVVRVTDDGPGIPAGAEDTLFEPFFRLDRSRSKKTGGYGLGLSICKRIMEAHGGSIAVERDATRGATFVLRFPRSR